jgi:hypothetical protein
VGGHFDCDEFKIKSGEWTPEAPRLFELGLL